MSDFDFHELPIPQKISVTNPLHVLQKYLRGAAVSVAGDALSGFQGAVIFKKICDAGRAKGVRRIVNRESS